jgi:hypothetical protein
MLRSKGGNIKLVCRRPVPDLPLLDQIHFAGFRVVQISADDPIECLPKFSLGHWTVAPRYGNFPNA